MPDILDLIQTIARQRGRGDSSPLILLRALDGSPGERISHLPIDTELSQAWLALMGEPFRPHQSQAITALRRGEPVALFAANPRVATTSYLLAYALLNQDQSSAVLLAPDSRAAQAAYNRLLYINENLPATMRLHGHLVQPQSRPDPTARIVITTPETLHHRLLRHHDRTWNLFWPHVRLLTILDIHRYNGIAGAHLADLLLRTQRIVAAHSKQSYMHLLTTGWEIDEPQAALESLYNVPWKIIGADDLPHTPTALGVWRGSERLREAVDLARSLQRQEYRVHLLCSQLELAALTPMLGEVEGISAGPTIQQAHALVCVGYPASQSQLRRLLRAGYQAVIVVLGDLPVEQMLARHTETLLSNPPSRWPTPPLNAYVTAQHILCAASELPLTEAEVEASGIGEIVSRLVANDQLIDLPDPEIAWKPGRAAADPYADLSLLSASGGPVSLQLEAGRTIDQLDPSLFERWCYPNAALPPGHGGLRVVSNDTETSVISLRLDTSGRRTYPLRRCTITPREDREERRLFLTSRIGFGKAVVDEAITGSRDATLGNAPTETTLRTTLANRWVAPCCWFELASSPSATNQLVGWSLAAAISLQALAQMTDVVPVYVTETRRLYLVDSQPGGNGLAEWVFRNAEDLLPVAYDIALACRNDPLLEPAARADMDWLLLLLGRRAEQTPSLVLPSTPAPRSTTPRRDDRPATEPAKLILMPAPEPPAETRPPQPAAPRSPQPATREEERRIEQSEQMNRQQRWESARPPERQPSPTSDEQRQMRIDEPPKASPQEPPKQAAPAEPPQAPTPRGRSANTPRSSRRANEQPKRGKEAPARGSQQKPPQQPAPPQPAPQQPKSRTPAPQPPAKPSTPEPAPEPATPDANALIERLRRQRQQRENQRGPSNVPRASSRPAEVELRFKTGDRVFCMPWGEGTVNASYAENDREMLEVDFPQHGELTIDPSVSLVRKLEDEPEEDDLL